MSKWRVWWTGGWDAGWNVSHPDVDLGYPYWDLFSSLQEAMDFVCEYERVQDWAREHDYEAMAMALDPRGTWGPGWEYLNSYPEDDLEAIA